MSHVATPSGSGEPNPLSAAELTLRCEREMDAMTVLLTDNGYSFAWWHSHISPTAVCHVPWPTPCRTPFVDTPSPRPRERGYSALHQPPFGLVLRRPRMEMQRQDWPEEKWQEFAYKRKKTVSTYQANRQETVFSIGFCVAVRALNHTDMPVLPLRCRYAFPASSDSFTHRAIPG